MIDNTTMTMLNRYLVRLQSDHRISTVSIIIDNAAGASICSSPVTPATPKRTPCFKLQLQQQRLPSLPMVPDNDKQHHQTKRDHHHHHQTTTTSDQQDQKKKAKIQAQHAQEQELFLRQQSHRLSDANEKPRTGSTSFMKLLIAEHDCPPQDVRIIVDRTELSPPPSKTFKPLSTKVDNDNHKTKQKQQLPIPQELDQKQRHQQQGIPPLPPTSNPQALLKDENILASTTTKGGVGGTTIPFTLNDVVDPQSRQRASPLPRTA